MRVRPIQLLATCVLCVAAASYTRRVEFSDADSRLALGEDLMTRHDFAGASVVAADVGRRYQEMELDPRWADMPQMRREAARRRDRVADLAVSWENRRRLSAIRPAVEARRAAGTAACVVAAKAAAAAAAVHGPAVDGNHVDRTPRASGGGYHGDRAPRASGGGGGGGGGGDVTSATLYGDHVRPLPRASSGSEEVRCRKCHSSSSNPTICTHKRQFGEWTPNVLNHQITVPLNLLASTCNQTNKWGQVLV